MDGIVVLAIVAMLVGPALAAAAIVYALLYRLPFWARVVGSRTGACIPQFGLLASSDAPSSLFDAAREAFVSRRAGFTVGMWLVILFVYKAISHVRADRRRRGGTATRTAVVGERPRE